MCALGYSKPIKFWCPECNWWTAGIIDDGKRFCIRCHRDLWRCPKCHRLTFGVTENPDQCKCGE